MAEKIDLDALRLAYIMTSFRILSEVPTHAERVDALLVPEAAEVVAPDRVRLRFAAPVGRQARLNWAAQNGTNPLDVTDRGQPGFRGLSDATGIVAAAAALLPVLPDPP